jgi:hypothetical protein
MRGLSEAVGDLDLGTPVVLLADRYRLDEELD